MNSHTAANFDRVVFIKSLLVVWSKWVAIILILSFFIASIISISGGRYNYTPSFPMGLYWVIDKAPEKGDLVLFCPTNNDFFAEAKKRQYISTGYCNGGYGELLKRITAVEGDTVTATRGAIFVNGKQLVNSANMITDKYGREMSAFLVRDYTLKKDEVLFMSEYNASSFDGRYFGIQSTFQIEDVISPVFTE